MAFKEFEALLEQEAESSTRPEPLRPSILVVDDDELIREGLKALFERRYQVLTCASALEGLAALHPEVCAIILDVKMKGHDGFWACDEIRKRDPEVPIIFYSAYQDVKDPYDIINQHRPFGYLTKNGDREQLERSVDMAVRLHQLTLSNKRLVARLRAGWRPRE